MRRATSNTASNTALLLLIGVAAGLALSSAPATAQGRKGKPVRPTEKQVELGQDALDAFLAGDYERAIFKYRQSLNIQELNLTYVTLGYALFADGRCFEAGEAYAAAARAPRVAAPPSPAELARTLADYQAQLPEKCAQIILTCSAPDITYSVSGSPQVPCFDGPVWLATGPHTIIGRSPTGLEDTHQLEVDAGDKVEIVFDIADVSVDVVDNARLSAVNAARLTMTSAGERAERIEAGPPLYFPPPSITFYATAGAGAALLLTAFVYDLAVLGPNIDDLRAASAGSSYADLEAYNRLTDDVEGQQSLTLALAGVGAAAIVAAGVIYIVEFSGAEAPPPDEAGLTGWVTPSGGGVGWAGSF